jgi:hypothetical protein
VPEMDFYTHTKLQIKKMNLWIGYNKLRKNMHSDIAHMFSYTPDGS